MEQKDTFSNKIAIRVTLEGDLARKFDLIKSRKGVKNNTELIRLLIAEEFARSP
jgi:metal-responsive CopG/Arc/MetJ family transcriptional regulator